MNIKKLRELKKNKKGFTLIEIIVVVVILAVLMAVAVPSVLKYMGEADEAKYMSQARGAYIAAQQKITKDYVTSKAIVTSLTNTNNAIVEGKPQVTTIEFYKQSSAGEITVSRSNDTVTVANAEAVATTDSPEKVALYVVTFAESGGKTYKAVVQPNASVSVGTTVTIS